MRGNSLYFLLLIAAVAITGCARRTSITGGAKDTLAPVLRNAVPKNYNTNFSGREIKLTFDEYVKLKNASKQLIVSPPMTTAPEITPYSASRTITIKLRDTLMPNTTYSLNFGQSIEDNNEGNPLRQFKYVFSTGNHIDSLKLGGTVKDAFERQPDAFVSVMLYDAETFSDSTVYKENPRYITNTLDSASVFNLDNLKEGRYYIVALKDNNGNNRFEPATDKIGFHKEIVTLPNDTLYEMELFKEEKPFRLVKATQAAGNKLLLAYEGIPKGTTATLRDGTRDLSATLSKVADKDSLHLWHEPYKADSLQLTVRNGAYEKSQYIKLKNQKPDSLQISPVGSGLHLRERLKLKASGPISAINDKLISIKNKDSAEVAFTAKIDNYNLTLQFDFEPQPVERYKMSVLPGAITDMFGRANDTLSFTFATRNTSDYGNLRLTLENVRKYPVIVELTDENGKIAVSRSIESPGPVDFSLIDPMPYVLRVIYDDNANGRWDSGNFLKKQQAEEVIYFPKLIDVRANWDVDQVFRLP